MEIVDLRQWWRNTPRIKEFSPAIILGTKSFSEAVRTRRDQKKLVEFLKETTFSNATIIE